MATTKIDFNNLLLTVGGEVGGLAVVGSLNKVPAVQKLKPAIRGVIGIAIGKLALPFIAGKMGKGSDKTMGTLLGGVGNAFSVIGAAQLLSSVAPNIFPTISGVSGYEDTVYGLGLVTEEEDADSDMVNGVGAYEKSVYTV